MRECDAIAPHGNARWRLIAATVLLLAVVGIYWLVSLTASSAEDDTGLLKGQAHPVPRQ